MKTIHRLAAVLAALTFSIAHAGDTIKVGIIAEMSGAFAYLGQQMTTGARAYMKEHGDTVAGKKIELIVKDVGGPAPDVSKRLAQELVVKDDVDFIAGFGLTPNALAVAPVSTEAKKPTIIMNAATSIITTRSPYMARVSMTLPQVSAPLGDWAYKNGIRKVYTAVADYGPGIDAETAFKKTFTAAGGQIVGEVRMPLTNPDYGPFVARIKDTKPDAAFVFVPAGEAAVGFMKTYAERGLAAAGIKLIATGDVTDDGVIDALGNGRGRDGHDPPLLCGPRLRGEQGVSRGLCGRRLQPSSEFRGGRRLRRHGADLFGGQAVERQHRSRQGDGDHQGREAREPARADPDRAGHARRDAERVRARGQARQRQVDERRVRDDPDGEGSGEVTLRTHVRNVIPAKAGIQCRSSLTQRHWVPAFAGMTEVVACPVVVR